MKKFLVMLIVMALALPAVASAQPAEKRIIFNAGAGPAIDFVRVGTLDDPDRLPPDIHIFTASKQPWVVLPDGVPAVPEYYDRKLHWPRASLERRDAILTQIQAYQATLRDRKS